MPLPNTPPLAGGRRGASADFLTVHSACTLVTAAIIAP
jgi:hypothetical protein